MNLTVSQRITGGFFFTCGFLLLIAVVAVWGMQRVKGDLAAVADQSTPMVVKSGDLMAALLESSRATSRHFNGRTDDVVKAAKDEFDATAARYAKTHADMEALLGDDSDLRDELNQVDELARAYLDIVPRVLAAHEAELAAEKKARKARNNAEDLGDEIDASLQDMADSGRNRAVASKLASLVSEALVAAVDSLGQRNLAALKTAMKDLDSLATSITSRVAELRAGGAKQSDLDQLEEFRKLISGPQSLPDHHKMQLEQAAASEAAFNESDAKLNETMAALKSFLDEVQSFKDKASESASNAISFSNSVLTTTAIVALVFAAFVATWVVRSIQQPLSETVKVIEQVARGDMTVVVRVQNQDEFGRLAGSVNDLTRQLRTMLQKISETALALSSAAEQTAHISQQTHGAIHHQRTQTEQVVVSMTEMNSTVSDVARSANNTLMQVSQASSETSAGRTVVLQSIEAINRLAKEVQESVAVINRLDGYSAQIGTVLDVIRGIAEQTNLLALNAAIEAARAGEQGRGFAVVADEVRTLASRTQSSTQEIQQMIERLQTGARDAVQVMARSQREAESAVAQTSRAGESLEHITQSMNVINDMSTQIASAAEQQAAVTQEIHQNMTAISDVSEQTSQGAAQSLSASQELAQLATTLQSLVQQFRV